MEKIPPDSSWNLPQTARQSIQISTLCRHLGIKAYLDDGPTTRLEARNLIYDLRAQRKAKRKKK